MHLVDFDVLYPKRIGPVHAEHPDPDDSNLQFVIIEYPEDVLTIGWYTVREGPVNLFLGDPQCLIRSLPGCDSLLGVVLD
jgi:hypothetical protein